MNYGLIFDVDGTLLDSMPAWNHLGERYLRSKGRQPREGLNRILFKMTAGEGAAYLKEAYDLPWTAEEINRDTLEIIRHFYCYEVQMKEGARAFLKEMHRQGIPMTVASSGERDMIEAAFSRLQILGYFQAIFTAPEVGEGKSSPKIFQEAAKYMHTRPEHTYVFEDALYAIQTARAAGFKTVAVYDQTSENDLPQIKALADYFIRK